MVRRFIRLGEEASPNGMVLLLVCEHPIRRAIYQITPLLVLVPTVPRAICGPGSSRLSCAGARACLARPSWLEADAYSVERYCPERSLLEVPHLNRCDPLLLQRPPFLTDRIRHEILPSGSALHHWRRSLGRELLVWSFSFSIPPITLFLSFGHAIHMKNP